MNFWMLFAVLFLPFIGIILFIYDTVKNNPNKEEK